MNGYGLYAGMYHVSVCWFAIGRRKSVNSEQRHVMKKNEKKKKINTKISFFDKSSVIYKLQKKRSFF